MNIMKPILFNTPMTRAILDGRKTQTRRINKDGGEYSMPDMSLFDARRRTYGVHNYQSSGYNFRDKISLVEAPVPICPGDILWVRETWNVNNLREDGDEYEAGFIYKAEQKPDYGFQWAKVHPDSYVKYMDEISVYFDKWRPSIHMPKEAARIFLRVSDVRVERLQDITVDGINREGFDIEPPPICRNEAPTEEQQRKYNSLPPEKREEYIQTLARHRYMGWCKYADDLFHEWAKFWDSTIKPSDIYRYGWSANPWEWVYTFERISRDEAKAALKEETE